MDAMTKDTIIMLLGAFIALLPYLGFPHNWDNVFMVVCGLVFIAVGIAMRREKRLMRSMPERRPVTPPQPAQPQSVNPQEMPVA